MMPGETVLKKPAWETLASAMAGGKSREEAYMQAYGSGDSKTASRCVCRLLKNTAITDRITFLTNGRIKFSKQLPKSGKSNEVNLQSVIKTCQEVIETSESTPQKLKAIEVLNKLGVFDGETKGDKGRMDPAAICAWLAQFAGAPAENLKKIPGGLKGMLKALMELTGATKDELVAELMDSKASEIPMLAGPEDPVAKDETIETAVHGHTDLLDFEKDHDDVKVENEQVNFE